jgi:nucleoside-diphosphate-sugar epimerase
MAESGFQGKRLRVVVVGGGARSAQAFRRYVSTLDKVELTVLVRKPVESLPGEAVIVVADYFSPPEGLLLDKDAVVNFVGVTTGASEAHLSSLNVEGPARLARYARAQGVKHFIHLSSLHIYGDAEFIDRTTPEAPLSAYARSKQRGDCALSDEAGEGFTVTNLRMPMHYGYGAGDKLRRLASFIARVGWFPVRKARVERSVVHLDNLSAAIAFLIEKRLGGIQFTADPEPFSVEILAEIAAASTGRPIRLVRVPEILFLPLRVFAKGVYRRLYMNNVVSRDILLRTAYPVRLKEGLKDVFAR